MVNRLAAAGHAARRRRRLLRRAAAGRRAEDQGADAAPLRRAGRAHQRRHAGLTRRRSTAARSPTSVRLRGRQPRLQQRHQRRALRQGGRRARLGPARSPSCASSWRRRTAMLCSTELAARIEHAEPTFASRRPGVRGAGHRRVFVMETDGGAAPYAGTTTLQQGRRSRFRRAARRAPTRSGRAGLRASRAPVRVELSSLAEPSVAPLLCGRGYVLRGIENVLGRPLPPDVARGEVGRSPRGGAAAARSRHVHQTTRSSCSRARRIRPRCGSTP